MSTTLLDDSCLQTIGEKASVLLQENVIGVEKIPCGMTNKNFKIITRNNVYVLRILGTATDLLINRNEEYAIIKSLEKKGIDVETVFFDTVSGIKITRYVEDNFSSIMLIEEKCTVALRLLKQLHYSGLTFRNDFLPIKKIHQYESVMYKNNIPLESGYALLKKKIDSINKNFISKCKNVLCPCHNDLVSENILRDKYGRAYLIDWEYAGMNDPLWDLASFSLENNLNAAEEKMFVEKYFEGAMEKDTHEVIFIYKIYQDILWSLWSSVKSFFGSDYKEYGKARYERGLENIKLL